MTCTSLPMQTLACSCTAADSASRASALLLLLLFAVASTKSSLSIPYVRQIQYNGSGTANQSMSEKPKLLTCGTMNKQLTIFTNIGPQDFVAKRMKHMWSNVSNTFVLVSLAFSFSADRNSFSNLGIIFAMPMSVACRYVEVACRRHWAT